MSVRTYVFLFRSIVSSVFFAPALLSPNSWRAIQLLLIIPSRKTSFAQFCTQSFHIKNSELSPQDIVFYSVLTQQQVQWHSIWSPKTIHLTKLCSLTSTANFPPQQRLIREPATLIPGWFSIHLMAWLFKTVNELNQLALSDGKSLLCVPDFHWSPWPENLIERDLSITLLFQIWWGAERGGEEERKKMWPRSMNQKWK